MVVAGATDAGTAAVGEAVAGAVLSEGVLRLNGAASGPAATVTVTAADGEAPAVAMMFAALNCEDVTLVGDGRLCGDEVELPAAPAGGFAVANKLRRWLSAAAVVEAADSSHESEHTDSSTATRTSFFIAAAAKRGHTRRAAGLSGEADC